MIREEEGNIDWMKLNMDLRVFDGADLIEAVVVVLQYPFGLSD